jgi:hypothetical protein
MKLTIFMIILALLMGACQTLDISSIWMDLPSNNVLFQDDFSNPSSGWQNLPDSLWGSRYYKDGSYHIKINSIYSLLTSTPGLNFSDVQIHVNATKKAGPDDNNYGIICRWQDVNNFYFLVISSDGYFGIGKVSNGQQTLIGLEKMLPSDAVQQGLSTNHLRADCVGDMLSLHVNSEHLITVQDADFSYGDVGLLAGTFIEPGVEIEFTNFSVLKP